MKLCRACKCIALMSCKRCLAPYCTVECQKLEWDKRGHKALCKSAAASPPESAPASGAISGAPADAVIDAAKALAEECSGSSVGTSAALKRAALLKELHSFAAAAAPGALLASRDVLLQALLHSWRNACCDVMHNRLGIKIDVEYGCCSDFYEIRGKTMYNVAHRRPEMDALEAGLKCCGISAGELHSLLGVHSLDEVPRTIYPLEWDGILELDADGRGCHDGGLPDSRGGPPRRGWVTNASGTEARKHVGGGDHMFSYSQFNQRDGGEPARS